MKLNPINKKKIALKVRHKKTNRCQGDHLFLENLLFLLFILKVTSQLRFIINLQSVQIKTKMFEIIKEKHADFVISAEYVGGSAW